MPTGTQLNSFHSEIRDFLKIGLKKNVDRTYIPWTFRWYILIDGKFLSLISFSYNIQKVLFADIFEKKLYL